MTAVAPPPVGSESEPSVTTDNAAAVSALQAAHVELPVPQPAAQPRRTRGGAILAALVIGGATALAATIGAQVNKKKRNLAWYHLLRKPSYTPPDPVFGLVWTPLYALGAYSAFRVWQAPDSKERTAALALWGTQLAFNGAWSWLFFGKHRPRLALADLAGNYLSLGAYALAAAKVDRPAAALVTPQLGWLSFAGALNAGIVRRTQLVPVR
jgi:tryptophan-rich sensory protein